MEGTSWLASFLRGVEEETRRRGDSQVVAEHLGLALTRAPASARHLLATLGVDPVDWRDAIITVLGWWEGANAVRDGRPAGDGADSPAERRFTGIIGTDATVTHVIELAESEARSNHGDVAPAHLLIGLLLEGQSVPAATGSWLGLTPGRIRSAAGLQNERRVAAGGASPGGPPRASASGPMVLSGGAPDDALLADIVDLACARGTRPRPTAALVNLGWRTLPPSPEERRHHVERWTKAGAHAVDSGLTHRSDGDSSEVCERLATADLIWFSGGDAAFIYDRLWATPALEAIRHAHENGALVGGVSAGSRAWGTGTLSDFASLGELEPFPLHGWLPDLVIFNHYGPTREGAFRHLLSAFPSCQGLAIAHGGAVLIPAGETEPQLFQQSVSSPSYLLADPTAPLRELVTDVAGH